MSKCDCKGCDHRQLESDLDVMTKLANLMNKDERRVLLKVAYGLVNGRKVYGPLETSTEKRDMVKETLDEVRDALVYVGIRLVQLEQ